MEHITTLSLYLKGDKELAPNFCADSLGPMLQSVLMDCIDKEYAQYLHASGFKPYSQHCTKQGNDIIWKINTLNNQAANYIIEPAKTLETFLIKNLDTTFSISKTVEETIGIDSLVNILKSEQAKTFKVQFLTPTAFKSKGSYVIMPDIQLIFQNLLMHYNMTYSGSAEVEQDTIEYIASNTKISSYNLRSRYFSRTMSKQDKIPAFIGSATIYVTGAQALRGLVAMLLNFAQASGIGIKTSMGMGGVQLMKNVSVKNTAKKEEQFE